LEKQIINSDGTEFTQASQRKTGSMRLPAAVGGHTFGGHREPQLIMKVKLTYLLALLFVAGCSEPPPSWTTRSGLQVTEFAQGEGGQPKDGDIVKVRYNAWYMDTGKKFDSTDNHTNPFEFRIGGDDVLPGFDEGISSMRKGGKRILVMPPELAFGKEGRPGVVPPNTWVKFEVELVDFETAPPPPEMWSDEGHEVVTLENGLQYIEYEEGDGPSPRPGDVVIVFYSGFLDNGKVFDTTHYDLVPIEFELQPGRVIDGFLEGLMMMKVGARRKLIIPPYLAYGDEGFGKRVPPNATLTYDVVLEGIRQRAE